LPMTNGGNIDLYYLGLDRKQAVFDKASVVSCGTQ